MSENLQIAKNTRERFIPISKQEIVADLSAAPHWNSEEQKQFSEFCQIFAALYHYKFHTNLEELKRCYAPFNPDTDIVTQREHSDAKKSELHHTLVSEMRQLLNNANYEELTVDEINHAMDAGSYYGVKVSVDLDDFTQIITYYRGASTMIEYKRTWTTLFLLKKRIEIPIYERLFLLLHFKTEDERVQDILRNQKKEWDKDHSEETLDQDKMSPIEKTEALKTQKQDSDKAQKEKWEDKLKKFEKKARKQVRKSRQNLPDDVTDKHIFIKLFKNIPCTDLEMLFPNQNIRLKVFDKVKLAITGGGSTIGGIASTIAKIATTNPVALIVAFVGLIGVIFRQVMKVFTQRTEYMMVLSRNLYFHNLDNNAGVMNYLIDMAEEEEGKEAILAYYFLHTQRDKNYTQDELDREIENYIQDKYGIDIDFEVDDGLRKLREEGILIEHEDGGLKVLDLQKACINLDKKWDAFFNPAAVDG